MDFKFELKESKIEGIEYFGNLILEDAERGIDNVKINITVRKGENGLFICLPSRKDKDDQYYNIVFLSNDLYNRINKRLNKEYK
jgi:DNA-binding cell septation regulator SpoVG